MPLAAQVQIGKGFWRQKTTLDSTRQLVARRAEMRANSSTVDVHRTDPVQDTIAFAASADYRARHFRRLARLEKGRRGRVDVNGSACGTTRRGPGRVCGRCARRGGGWAARVRGRLAGRVRGGLAG